MTSDINMLIAQPNAWSKLGDAWAQGMEQGRIRNALAEIGKRARSGDLAGASSLAFEIGDTRTGNAFLDAIRNREQDAYTRRRDVVEDELKRRQLEQGEYVVVGDRLVNRRTGQVRYQAPDPFVTYLGGSGGVEEDPVRTATGENGMDFPPPPQNRNALAAPPTPAYAPAPSNFSGSKGDLQRGAYGVPQVGRAPPAMPTSVQGDRRRWLTPEVRAKAMELYRMGDKSGAEQLMRKAILNEPERPGVRVGPDGRLEIVEPPVRLDKAASNEMQKSAANDTLLLSQTDEIGKLVDDQFLTYRGQIRGGLAKFREKLGANLDEPTKQFLGNLTRFRTTTERLFNAYRKEITGAAAAVAELERLKASFINSDMSPTEFRAALNQYQGELKRTLRLRTKLLRQGIDPRTDEGGAVFDQQFLGGGDDDMNTRFQELSGEGLSKEQIFERLETEGY